MGVASHPPPPEYPTLSNVLVRAAKQKRCFGFCYLIHRRKFQMKKARLMSQCKECKVKPFKSLMKEGCEDQNIGHIFCSPPLVWA